MEVIYYQDIQKIPIKSWCDILDDGTREQALNLANHPVTRKWVALMPDAHAGYGMPIGGVILCENAVIPNAVGVDIGCGVRAVKTGFNASAFDKQTLRKISDEIKKVIPVGFGVHQEPQQWDGFEEYIETATNLGWGWFTPDVFKRARRSLGTLGGGNHFIELQRDDGDCLWVMIHSGSRNLGKQIADHYHKWAVELNGQYHSDIPTPDLAFLPDDSAVGQCYIEDMNFALTFAQANREFMMSAVLDSIEAITSDCPVLRGGEIDVHHNYATIENHFGKNYWIHRKGATAAWIGDYGLIPGSMGTKSYVVFGKGSKDSFSSCSHGAGRRMGRTAANASITLEMAERAVSGVVCDRFSKITKGKQKGLYDVSESPQAYKPIDEVINAQLDLVSVAVELTPILNVKG